ncbi:MAG: aminomethyltransferase family protein [Deltaproteobacteria bacterium]|nr:aminomethyltransferase family protein [Deltaproteobacteria bacterium]
MGQNYFSASYQTMRLSARRFEISPFLNHYQTDDMVFGAYAGRFYPLFCGQDVLENYWKLRRQVVLFDVPERPIRIKGPDAIALLEKVFTRKISTLKVGRARYGIACLPTGGIFMDGVLIRLSDDEYWYVQANGDMDNWLAAHGHGLDVEISDPKSWVLQIQGPRSMDVLKAVTNGVLDENDFGYFHTRIVEMGGQNILVSRTGWTNELGFEIYTQGTDTDCDALWAHLMKHGEPHGMVFNTLDSMGIRRIEGGILDNGTDMDPSMTPYEAGLGAFVHLDKGDFIGRDALQNASREPLLVGLKCKTAVPLVGLEVFDADEAVAAMKIGAWSPFLDCGIGYVRFHQSGDWMGKELRLRDQNGDSHPCEIVDLPFYDAEKRIPRGLDRKVP